jgi:hypothetical protein
VSVVPGEGVTNTGGHGSDDRDHRCRRPRTDLLRRFSIRARLSALAVLPLALMVVVEFVAETTTSQ